MKKLKMGMMKTNPLTLIKRGSRSAARAVKSLRWSTE